MSRNQTGRTRGNGFSIQASSKSAMRQFPLEEKGSILGDGRSSDYLAMVDIDSRVSQSSEKSPGR